MQVEPELIRRLDELVRTDLQQARDWYFKWLLISTGVVFVGVLLEGPEVLHEAREELRNYLPQKVTVNFGTGMPVPGRNLLLPWIRLLSLVGWILVFFGVIGEGVFEGLVSRGDGWIQRLNDTLLSTAEVQVSAARLEQEKLRAANLELERLVLGRQLSTEQINKVGRSLKRFSRRSVFISSYVGDAEAARLGIQIIAALRVAGIDTDNNLGRTTAGRGGVAFDVQISGPASEKALIDAIAKALRDDGGIYAEGQIIVPTMRIESAVTGIFVALRRVPGAN